MLLFIGSGEFILSFFLYVEKVGELFLNSYLHEFEKSIIFETDKLEKFLYNEIKSLVDSDIEILFYEVFSKEKIQNLGKKRLVKIKGSPFMVETGETVYFSYFINNLVSISSKFEFPNLDNIPKEERIFGYREFCRELRKSIFSGNKNKSYYWVFSYSESIRSKIKDFPIRKTIF